MYARNTPFATGRRVSATVNCYTGMLFLRCQRYWRFYICVRDISLRPGLSLWPSNLIILIYISVVGGMI